jgi:uncharacterized protein (DUF488 family)
MEETRHEYWKSSKTGVRLAGTLPKPMRTDIAWIVARFRIESIGSLIDYVYQAFPQFTVNSEIKKREERHVAALAVYTMGYEGLQVDGFLNSLLCDGIQQVIDVRNNPVSRQYGFHKNTLARLCESVEIDYWHVPQLGVPRELRGNLETPTEYEALFARYERELLPAAGDALAQVVRLVKLKPAALVCMEADPACCHRSRLATVVARKTRLSVRHLRCLG